VAIVSKSGSLNLLEPSGPVQACNGIALTLLKVLIEDRSTCMLCTPLRFWLLNAPDSLEFSVSFFDGFNVGWFNTLPSRRSIKQIKAILKTVKFIEDVSG
jgi:hypothetical protein